MTLTIVFDLDGTLVDTAADVAALINPMLAGLGRGTLTPAEAASCFGLGAAKFVERALNLVPGPALSDAALTDLMARFGAVYATALPVHSRPFAHVPETLADCRARGWRMAVCTNKPARATETLLSALDLIGYFDAISGGDSAPARKPDPVHVLDAINRAGGNRTRAILVGDSETDAAAGRAAGVPTILVEGGYTQQNLTALGATRIVPGFAGLADLLAELDPGRDR